MQQYFLRRVASIAGRGDTAARLRAESVRTRSSLRQVNRSSMLSTIRARRAILWVDPGVLANRPVVAAGLFCGVYSTCCLPHYPHRQMCLMA
ncbi:hypothetical protein DENSPDRAFT_354289 [Dentipellis sp. KUC8613]|nr:hypothetical protein DENSPDRAFT_354289 [Dentipellis sp. KUC8613]